MGPAVNRDNHELVLPDFDNRELVLPDFNLCTCEYEFQLHKGLQTD